MSDQVLTIANQRRLGVFVIDQEVLQRMDLRQVRRAMAPFIVLGAASLPNQPRMTVYTAYSHLFDPIGPSDPIPQYKIKVGKRVSVEREQQSGRALEALRRSVGNPQEAVAHG